VRTLKKVGLWIGLILGIYLIGRALVELFVIDYSNPASYRSDWGGPSLAGVLAIHCGFGLLSAVAIGAWLSGRFRRRAGVTQG
jgi:hypothetical protein